MLVTPMGQSDNSPELIENSEEYSNDCFRR